MVFALEWHSGVWLRVVPLHKVPGSLVPETMSGTKLSEGKLCYPYSFQPEVCAVVVIRPKELKNGPNIPPHPRLQNALGMEMAAPFSLLPLTTLQALRDGCSELWQGDEQGRGESIL